MSLRSTFREHPMAIWALDSWIHRWPQLYIPMINLTFHHFANIIVLTPTFMLWIGWLSQWWQIFAIINFNFVLWLHSFRFEGFWCMWANKMNFLFFFLLSLIYSIRYCWISGWMWNCCIYSLWLFITTCFSSFLNRWTVDLIGMSFFHYLRGPGWNYILRQLIRR